MAARRIGRYDGCLGTPDLTRVEVEGDHDGLPERIGRAGAVAARVDRLRR